MAEVLAQVTAPHFCAGVVVRDGVIVEAAPILRWTIGMTRAGARGAFSRKGWKSRVVPGHDDD